MKELFLLLFLLLVPVYCSATEACQAPEASTIDKIKQTLISELRKQEKDDVKVTTRNLIITQSYEKKDYILTVYSYDCCYEGGIVLYKKTKESIKDIAYFNGFADDGAFIGYDKRNVKKYFQKYLPLSAKPILKCYQYHRENNGESK